MFRRVKMSKLYLQVTPKDLPVVTPKKHFAVAPKDTRELVEYIFVCRARSLFAVMPGDICFGCAKGRFERGRSGDIFGRAIRFSSPSLPRTFRSIRNRGESS